MFVLYQQIYAHFLNLTIFFLSARINYLILNSIKMYKLEILTRHMPIWLLPIRLQTWLTRMKEKVTCTVSRIYNIIYILSGINKYQHFIGICKNWKVKALSMRTAVSNAQVVSLLIHNLIERKIKECIQCVWNVTKWNLRLHELA